MQHICPHCNSENIQAFRVAYENGTSVSVGKTTGVGVGFAGGGLGVGVGGATTTTQNTSLLAQKVAPPAAPKTSPLLILGYVVGFFLYIIPAVLLWYFVGRKMAKKKQAEYEARMAEWNRSWLCFKCGNAFTA